MTVQEFKASISKASWFEKYYYYLISFAIIGVGFLFLYLAFSDKIRQQTTDLKVLIFCAAIFFFVSGSLSLYLIPNRYKILNFDSKIPIDQKKKIVADIMKDFGAVFIDNPRHFWSFNYQRRWWTFGYNIYLTFDSDTIFASVISRTHERGGFIDLGQTERFRKNLKTIIIQKLTQE